MDRSFVLAIHAGAGTIATTETRTAPFHEALICALQAGEVRLRDGASALDAVEAAVVALEDCPLFNAGRGSVYTRDQTHEMDAAIMDGASLRAGAIAGVSDVRNPVCLARHVLEASGAVLLCGAGARKFADERGIAREEAAYFRSEYRLAQLRILQRGGTRAMALDHSVFETAPLDENQKYGTVGAVALDRSGNLAAAVSTGGMTNKRPGRVGDSPIVGAGIYANNETCAISSTGSGEQFIRAVVAHDIHARMKYAGATLQHASREAVFGNLAALGGEGGLVAIDRHGNVAMPFNTRGMYRGLVRDGAEARTYIHE